MSGKPNEEALADLMGRVAALQTALETASAEQRAIIERLRELSPGTAEDTTVIGLPPSMRPWRVALAGALAASILGTVGLLLFGGSSAPANAICPPALAVIAGTIPAPSPVSQPTPPPATAPPAVAESTGTVAASSPATTSAPLMPPAVAVSGAARALPRLRCDPPYTIGTDGVRRNKPECLGPETDIFSDRY